MMKQNNINLKQISIDSAVYSGYNKNAIRSKAKKYSDKYA